MSTTSFDKFAQFYDEVMGDSGDYTHQQTIDPALFKAAGNIKDKVVYDIGTGNGTIARKLSKKGAKEVWASDISAELIKFAQEKYLPYKIKYFVQEGSDFKGIPENYFDLVIINMAIHYIQDLDQFFQGVNRILKKTGQVVFTLDHPLKNAAHLDEKRLDSTEKFLEKTQNYLQNKKIKVYNHWTRKKDLVIYIRPLEIYIKYLSKNGLLISNFIEPETKQLNSYHNGKIVTSKIPAYLAIGAIKT